MKLNEGLLKMAKISAYWLECLGGYIQRRLGLEQMVIRESIWVYISETPKGRRLLNCFELGFYIFDALINYININLFILLNNCIFNFYLVFVLIF